MNRRKWWATIATLFGAGAAQAQKAKPKRIPNTPHFQQLEGYQDGGLGPVVNDSAVVDKWPRVGECPTCGTMHEPYIQERYEKDEEMPVSCGPSKPRKLGDASSWLTSDCAAIMRFAKGGEPKGPPSRLVRCSRCSNAFWQDAEK